MAKKKQDKEGAFKELQDHMQRFQKDRDRRRPGNQEPTGDQTTIESVKVAITPVVNAFVEGDRSLTIQSESPNSYYIGYGYLKICCLMISADNAKSVVITLQSDSGHPTVVFSGANKKPEVQKAVKHALMTWYTSIF